MNARSTAKGKHRKSTYGGEGNAQSSSQSRLDNAPEDSLTAIAQDSEPAGGGAHAPRLSRSGTRVEHAAVDPESPSHPKGQLSDDEDELEVMQIDAILREPPTPAQNQDSPLARPVPVSPLMHKSSHRDSLFTPPSSQPPEPRKRKILKLSHIAIPSFPSGLNKAHYKLIRSASALSVRQLPITGTRVHASVGDALQAAMMHNASGAQPSFTGSPRNAKPRTDKGKARSQATITEGSKRKSSKLDSRQKSTEASTSTSLKRKRSQPDAKIDQIRRAKSPQRRVSFQPGLGDESTRRDDPLLVRSKGDHSSIINEGITKQGDVGAGSATLTGTGDGKEVGGFIPATPQNRIDVTTKVREITKTPADHSNLDSSGPSRLKQLSLLNGHPPVFSLVTGCSSRLDGLSSSARDTHDGVSSVPHNITQLQPAFESRESRAESATVGPPSLKRKRIPPCPSSPTESMSASTNLAVADRSGAFISQSTSGDGVPHTPTPNKGSDAGRDGHEALPGSSPATPTPRRDGVSTSPAARLKSARVDYKSLFQELFSSPDDQRRGKSTEVHGLDTPSRFQMLRSPSTFMVDFAADAPSDTEAGSGYDQLFATLHQQRPATPTEPPFGTQAIATAGRDVMLADSVSEQDINEMFHLPLPLSSPGSGFRLEYQLTQPGMSDHDHRGNSLVVQDAIAHGDVDRWLVDDREQDGQTDDLFSTPPDHDDISGNDTVDLFLLNNITETQNVVVSAPTTSRSASPDQQSEPGAETPDNEEEPIKATKPAIEPRSPSTRISRAPVRVDMVGTDRLVLSSSEQDDTSSSSSSSDEGDSRTNCSERATSAGLRGRRPVHPSKRLSLTSTESRSGMLPPAAKRGRPVQTVVNGVPDDAEPTFCHHCRRKTTRGKMTCGGLIPRGRKEGEPCQKRFCAVCLEKHYLEITFDAENAAFVCPWCSDTCRCSVCTRSRGEEYIGERGQYVVRSVESQPSSRRASMRPKKRKRVPAEKLLQTKASSVPAQLPQFPPPDPEFFGKATTFWGTVYGLTGECVGKAFIGDDGDERIVVTRGPVDVPPGLIDSASVPPAVTSTSTCRSEKRKSRVFVGKVQAFWGIDVKRIRDLEPTPPLTRMEKLNPSGVRFYIGDRAMLRRRKKSTTVATKPGDVVSVREREPSPAWSLGSDLTELSDEEVSGNRVVDELPSGVVILGEADVARAIEAAVGALSPKTT